MARAEPGRAEQRAARSEGSIAPLTSDAAAGDGTSSQMGMRRLGGC